LVPKCGFHLAAPDVILDGLEHDAAPRHLAVVVEEVADTAVDHVAKQLAVF
jgi:predicted small metal-binding protein